VQQTGHGGCLDRPESPWYRSPLRWLGVDVVLHTATVSLIAARNLTRLG